MDHEGNSRRRVEMGGGGVKSDLSSADDGSVAASAPHQCVCVLYNSVIKLPLGSDRGRWASYLWVRCVRWKALAADLHLAHHSSPTDGCLTTKADFKRICLWFMKCFLCFPNYKFSFLINVYISICQSFLKLWARFSVLNLLFIFTAPWNSFPIKIPSIYSTTIINKVSVWLRSVLYFYRLLSVSIVVLF